MVDIQTVSIAIASASVVAGVIYYSLQIRHQNLQIQHQNQIRQTDLVMRLYTTFGSKEYLDAYSKVVKMEFRDYDDFLEKYGWTDVNQVSILFEGIGVLLHRELIDIELVAELFGGVIERVWNKIKPTVEVAREKNRFPTLDEWFEYLYNEMQKRNQQLQSRKD